MFKFLHLLLHNNFKISIFMDVKIKKFEIFYFVSILCDYFKKTIKLIFQFYPALMSANQNHDTVEKKQMAAERI